MRRFNSSIPQGAEEFYRAHYNCRANNHIEIYFRTYFRVQDTPKGFWVTQGPGQPLHLILSGAKKRFAHETKEEALASLKRRTELNIRWLRYRLDTAERVLDRLHRIDAEELSTF